jgi:hypothetical protein
MIKKCLIIDCLNPAAKRDDFCEPCGYWVRVTLADKWYRNHKPPERPRQIALLTL